MKFREENAIGELGSAIGKGLIAGLAGTAAMTLSQLVEMKITGRKPSEAPVKVASEITGIKPVNANQKEKVSNEIHWAYGTGWGIARGIVGLTGLKGVPAALVHFAAIWGTSMIMLPAFKIAPPVFDEEPQSVTVDGLHHAIYALTAGLVYDALDSGTHQQQKLDRLVDALRVKGIINKLKY